jgi:ankyrin repeat protein
VAKGGHKDVIALLLDKGTDVAATTEDGLMTLDFAERDGHEDMVVLLKNWKRDHETRK